MTLPHQLHFSTVVATIALAAFTGAASAQLAADAVDAERHPVSSAPVTQTPRGVKVDNRRMLASILPRVAILSASQSPVKHQGERDTCGSYATVAALEAAYKRTYGLQLDLSEQYLHHFSQMRGRFGVDSPRLPMAETWSGQQGGGGMGRPFGVLAAGDTGVPPESEMPYFGRLGYQRADVDDDPYFPNTDFTQRAVDDFNLSGSSRAWVFEPPRRETWTVLPHAALEQARFRPTSLTYAGAANLRNLAWFKAQLSSNHEVVFEFRCCAGDPGDGGTRWDLPANADPQGGHVMLMAGYDDTRQAFLVKNSWGTNWGTGGYVWMSYDFVSRGFVYNAGILNAVVDPASPFDANSNKQLFLGRWNLDYDGSKALLDIYNLPTSNLAAPVFQWNLRIGTLFLADGRGFRVNGMLDANRLDFWVDWANTDPPLFSTGGAHFTAYLFSKDTVSMAGTLTDPNGTIYSVQASKNQLATGNAKPGALEPASYLGTWDVNLDGARGTLEMTYVFLPSRLVVGRFTDSNGQVSQASISVDPDARKFALSISFASPQTFGGFLNGHELGVMSATRKVGGSSGGGVGLFASRR